MPRLVDHDQRRQAIAEAVRRIAADRGLEAVSLGQVAAEAGISKGLVQHYFPSKDDMLRYATTTLRERVHDQLPGGKPPRLRDVVVALLPLDDDARAEALVANAFLSRALKDDTIAARFRAGYTQLHELLATTIAGEQQEGTLASDLSPRHEADLLLALVAGLGDTLLLGHRDSEEVIALLEGHLARLAVTGHTGR
ncbi:TetR family transcriptional regulator [Prauserella marina]|uniref:DNA-binding transcriptional regulator, AcrR family n=1 Tax=Prauserella marina TaxID=530584 RepID=A0A222VR75_9PSEU|nr:TetR/AcrR family transcriptional regulator [Prauserella marina]ASR36231.1 TetR family transcriptional regulator [Prauserella marina]PWV76994.1 TetR family transcriptional regulator [Prauserella marina]SDD01954.1 DNA-binding transcriptional regulator, AcrR family [Prauserella marina]